MLKDNIEIIVERHKKLYSGTSGALVYINSVKTASSVPTPKVGKYSFPLEYKTYIKDCFDAFINNFKNKENLDDVYVYMKIFNESSNFYKVINCFKEA